MKFEQKVLGGDSLEKYETKREAETHTTADVTH